MRRSSDRGQFEPVVALAAVLAVSAGLVAYADTLYQTLPGDSERDSARIALDAIHDELRVAGVVDPERLNRTVGAIRGGWKVNVTLQSRVGRWAYGPAPPTDALRASKPVSVRVAPATLRPGTLGVAVWQ